MSERTRIPIKPLSTNRAWQGRRFKSKAYKAWEQVVVVLLNRMKPHIPAGRVAFHFEVGVDPRFDLDNAFKQTLDVIQKHHKVFDDKDVFEIHAYKKEVKRGDEYIEFHFASLKKGKSNA